MKIPSPKEFMKYRKPNKFSDSKIVQVTKLNRSQLEYHLNSLTSRKQEYQFEEFARKLSQYEICPNLRPQTGPTGGGDGKVDTESTPKSKELTILHFVGIEKSTDEKWAFAFSAKKRWIPKVKSDVKNIAETNRGYKRIFFITNQYAKASKRAELEDELSHKYGVSVTIHDRTWILDMVFENNREKLAIEDLGMSEGLDEKREIGPLDFQKEKGLKEINESIEKDVVNGTVNLDTVDDVLSSALLTAELEKPKTDINNGFDRAIKFAKEYGTHEQVFNAIYQKAWTTYFWLEDFNNFLKMYGEVEKLSLNSENIYFLERLRNLWSLLFPLSKNYQQPSDDYLAEKTKNLKDKLNKFKKNKSYITASVQAEEMILIMNLMLNMGNEGLSSKIFKDLIEIIDKANSLIGFPLEPTFKALNEMQDFYTGNQAYEELQEKIVNITIQRHGEIEAAKMLFDRGLQYYKSGNFYEAIKYLGKALYRFWKKESKDDLVIALFMLSMAYEDAGLLWAARGALINAASLATSDFWIYSKINRMQTICYERLRTIELRLGNVGYSLEWHRLHHMVATQLAKTDDDKNKLLDKDLRFGILLGLLLIKVPNQALKELEYLPESLFSLDLDFAAFGLIFRLGCHELFPKEFVKDQTPDEIQEFFDSYLIQPAQEQLPDSPNFYNKDTVQTKSKILGSEFIVNTPDSSPEIELGEYFLAAIESFLSTTMTYGAISRDTQIIIDIRSVKSQKKKIMYKMKSGTNLGIEITCQKFSPHKLNIAEQKEVIDHFSEAVLHLVAHTIMFQDPKADILKLYKDEEVVYRAFNFSTPLVSLGNVLGHNPKRKIDQWISDKNKQYPYVPGQSGTPKKAASTKVEKDSKKLQDFKQLRHDQIKNFSIIRTHLWDKAGWKGILYYVPPFNPPILGLMFEDKKAAEEIFENWIQQFSKEDKGELIRLSLLKGISQKNPTWYRAVLGINLSKEIFDKENIITVNKLHTMTPDTIRNLDEFLTSFKKFGVYMLAPALIDSQQKFPQLNVKLGIVKRQINIREAWKIGLNDFDMAGILDEDDIVVPKGIKSPPFLEIIKWRATKRNRKDEY